MPDPIYGFIPEGRDTFTLDSSLAIVATIPRVSSDELAVTCCFSRTEPATRGWLSEEDRAAVDIALWIAYDDAFSGASILKEVDARTGDILRTLNCVTDPNVLPNGLTIAEHSGRKALFDLGCNKLITVDRDTHEVIQLFAQPAAVGQAFVTKRYNLTIDPLDAILVDSDANLFYADGASMKLFSLRKNTPIRTVKTFAADIAWPCAVADGTYGVATNWTSSTPFLQDSDILRVTTTGRIVKTHIYDHDTFEEGLYGFVMRLGADPCGPTGNGPLVMAGDWDKQPPGFDEQPAYLLQELRNGAPFIDGGSSLVEGMALAYDEDLTSAFILLEYINITVGVGTPAPRPRPNRVCFMPAVTSPSPNAGCNPGGTGFTPSYTGPSGVVPIGDDPTDEDEFTDEDVILVDVEIEHTKDNGDLESLRYALVELDDTVRKEGRVESFGDIEHSFSDAQGNPKASTIQTFVMDFDGRPIGTRTNFARDPVTVRAISDRGRNASATPRMIGRGICTGESYGGSNILAQLVATDPMFAPGGAFGPDKRPCVRYPLSFYTTAPKDLANAFMPVILGEVSDSGATNPTTNMPASRGKMPARFVGLDTVTGVERGRFNACLFAIDLITELYGPDLGAMGLYGASAVASAPPDIPPGSIDDDGTSEEDPTADPNQTIWQLDETHVTLDLSRVATDGSFQLVVFSKDGRQELVIVGVDALANIVITDGRLDPAAAPGVPWYISSIDYVPRRVLYDLDVRAGVDVFVPKYDGYPRPTPYEDFTCTEGRFRVTDFWAEGAALAAVLGGDPTFAFNARGIEDKGDGSGTLIDDYFTAWDWWLTHQLHEPKTQPTIDIGGGVLGWPQVASDLPAWTDGWTKVMGSSFAACQAITAASLGGAGLKVSAYFADGTGTRDTLQLWLDNSGGAFYENNAYGRSRVWMLDRFQDASIAPRIDHVSQVFGDIDAPVAHDERQNVVFGEFAIDPEAGSFTEFAERKSLPAIERNKGVEQPSKHIDGRLIARRAHFEWVLDRKLGLYADAPRYVQLPNCGASLLNYPNGTLFQLTSVQGPGAQGWIDRAVIKLSGTYHIQTNTVSLLCLDVQNLLHGTTQGRGFPITDDTDLAPLITDDEDLAPVLAA